jgi:hypothetical protein
MKLTEKHVSDRFLDLTIRSCESIMVDHKEPSLTYYHFEGVLRMALELKQRRAEDRQLENNNK